jgi:cyanophycinase
MLKHLFLLGGSAAFEVYAEAFVLAAGGNEATIALLMQGGVKSQKYISEYTQPWIRKGLDRYHVIIPDGNGRLDLDRVIAQTREATGIFIGGGHTPTYHRLYATEPIRSILRERYEQGVPLAGCSAGALITPDLCVIAAEEYESTDSVTILPGLGLIGNLILGVHFSERNTLPVILEAMAKTKTQKGLGIDESACVVFEDGRFKRILGKAVHEVVMTNFDTKAYEITTCKAG